MAPALLADSAGHLAELEAQLTSVYTLIAKEHGLPAAMQALGRLMLSTTAAAPAPPPPSSPSQQQPVTTHSPAHLSTLGTTSTSTPNASPQAPLTAAVVTLPRTTPFTPPSPFSNAGADGPDDSPDSTSPTAPAGATAGSLAASAEASQRPTTTAAKESPESAKVEASASPVADSGTGLTVMAVATDGDVGSNGIAGVASHPIVIQACALAPPPPLVHLRTMESIRTLPSPSLSQMPSGVLSLLSPSAADGGSLADSEASTPLGRDVVDRLGGSNGGADESAAVNAVGVMAANATTASAAPKLAAIVTAAVDVVGSAIRVKATSPNAAAAADSRDGAESIKSNGSVGTSRGTPRSSSLWQRAINLSKAVADPWASRNLHALHMERGVRQRYNAHTGQWVTDEVLVKMESKPFAAGAMRECYAAKKLSTFTHNTDWHKAQNMVTKRYKKEGVRKSVYYNDVLVQMDAKMLGEMYNKTEPPKQVDVMQCAILQLPGRPGSPVYAVEQLIEGDYVKYNSNSGFVKGDDILRNTPQAFSHFTWVLTKGLKICVDIQGVGDLYTDPQLHTLDGEGYGEGNLGLRGMGLFFRSHECNALCARLGLKPFDRCDADVRTQGYTSDASSASASATRAGGARRATAARTVARTAGYKARQADRRRNSANAQSCALEVQLAILADVPKETPEALVHLEIAKLYGEVVLLPELRPNEDPEDALQGGLFHITAAAQGGSLLALLVLARAHCGLEPTSPQLAHLFKVGTRQRQFEAHLAVAWRCVLLAAERGVRGAALAAAAAYGSGSGVFGAEVLGGEVDFAQAARWYSAALALPDLLADEGVEGGDGEGGRGSGEVIHEGEEGEGASSSGSEKSEESEDELPQFEMSVMRDQSPPQAPGDHHHHHHHHISGLSDLDLGDPRQSCDHAALNGLRVPRLDELKPSRAFLARLKRVVEEEAAALPGAATAKYELLYQYGCVVLAGGPGLAADPTHAAELIEAAAEAAAEAGKGKLAQKYYEKVAVAQAAAEEEE